MPRSNSVNKHVHHKILAMQGVICAVQECKDESGLPIITLLEAGSKKSSCGGQRDVIMGTGSGDEFSTSIPPSIRPQSLYALFLMSVGRWIRYVRPFVQIIFMKGRGREGRG